MTDESDRDEILDEIRQLREDLDTDPELVPTEPWEAFELWLKQLDTESDSTIQSYRYRVKPFLDFLEESGIEDLNEVTSRDIKEFEAHRRDGTRNQQTLNNQFGTLRLFLRYCEELDAVDRDVVESVNVPALTKSERVNTETIIADRAQEIIDELDRYRYASRDHVLMLLLWRTTTRIGTIRSLDLDDIYLEDDDLDLLRLELADQYAPGVVDGILEETELPFLYPRHRPPETSLKNGEGGERVINLAPWVAEIVSDYIRVNRPDVVDDEGREPLLASKKGSGRLSKSAIRNSVYILTQPCEFGDPCPWDKDPETCEAREHGQGSKCPGSRSPHKIRTGSITHHRDRGWPISELAAKANTSEELISGVYDQPEKLIRGAYRRQHLDRLDEK